MKCLLLPILFLLLTLKTYAEEGGYSIKGVVLDSVSGSVVQLATISLKQAGDDKMISTITTGSDGSFTMDKIKQGDYELTISFIGYTSKKIPVSVRADVKLGAVRISSNANNLNETTITSERSLITKSAEKTVYNVAQSPTNQTGTAEDVLRNMPGVSVDQKGNISIIGKDGVKILVDGKTDPMANSNIQNFLRSVPASSIEAIELITNPSAKYDAEGNAGIINIKMKKGKADGFNGAVAAGYGYPNRYNGNISMNYKRNKVNWFGLLAGDGNVVGNRYVEDRTIMLNDTTSHYHLDSRGHEMHITGSLKTGLDWYINNKNTLTYTFGGNYTQLGWYSDANSKRSDASDIPMNLYHSINDDKAHFFSVSNDIAWKKKFDSTERELSVDVNYTYLWGNGGSHLTSSAYDTTGAYNQAGSLLQRTISRYGIHNFIAQLDYVHPLKWPGYKIETGLKNESTLNDNTYDLYRTANNVEQKDPLLSNAFNYMENVGAAYVILDGAYKKLISYSAGLRAEHTYIKSNNNSVDRQYLSWFPSASFNLNISDAQSFSVSYSRRVQRPIFRQINNTVIYIDQYSTWQGNPKIQPSFSHIISMNFTQLLKKHMFSLEASGNFQTGGFIESTLVDSQRITRGGYLNGADSKVFNLTFFFKLQLTKEWEFQANNVYSYSYFSFDPSVNTRSFQGSAYNLWLSTDVKFWKNTVFEINGWFNTGGAHSQGDAKPVGALNASIKKSFFKDRFTVALTGHNILNTMDWRWTVYSAGLTTNGSWYNYDRNVSINLTYRFGKGKMQPVKLKENERLSGGGAGR